MTIATHDHTTAMTPFVEARDAVVNAVTQIEPQRLDLISAAGKVLAEDVVAPFDVPSFDYSSMDGYAIRATDTRGASLDEPVRVPIVGRVMTGGALPDNADAVVPWEDAVVEGDRLTHGAEILRQQNVRHHGEVLKRGAVVMCAGEVLSPAHVGILASLGATGVLVTPSPTVAVLSSGDEVVSPGDPLPEHCIYDANTALVTSTLLGAGATPTKMALLVDDREAIRAWMDETAPHVDAIVTSGGASVGDRDWMRDVLGELGHVDLWRVALKPGKPFGFGGIGNTPVFVLPGNPASVLATMHAFVIPALRRMSGRALLASRSVILECDVAAPEDRVFLCPVFVEGDTATPAPAASSSVLVNHTGTNAYALIPPGGLKAGAKVDIEMSH